jgi:hypothetical protein
MQNLQQSEILNTFSRVETLHTSTHERIYCYFINKSCFNVQNKNKNLAEGQQICVDL